MSMNETPKSERLHIGFFGLRNAGKSSLVNAVTGQSLAIVSEIKGTTTDPVYKSMELLPLGPVTIIDTPGLDDEGELGQKRVQKTYQVLHKTDIAVLATDAKNDLNTLEKELIDTFKKLNIKYVIAKTKSDTINNKKDINGNEIFVSSEKNINIYELKELIASLYEEDKEKTKLVSDLISSDDVVILVTPIDKAAPKGRLILPQQQVLRDLLDNGIVSVVVREFEYKHALELLKTRPKLVITDSQVFEKISNETPDDIYLTSFSILMARYKGVLFDAVDGVNSIEKLENGDNILISEGCTHHRQCNDIGTVKLPMWLQKYTSKNFNFEYTSGMEFPEDLSKYKLVIHCGGCMLNDREVKYRYSQAKLQNVPITNYGILIAQINGILKRSIEIFRDKFYS